MYVRQRIFLHHRLRKLYSDLKAAGREPLPEDLLAAAGVRYRITQSGRIPASGPVLVVANRRFGLPEGLLLATVLPTFRGDTKILVNHLMTGLPELDPLLIGIDPWARRRATQINVNAMRAAVEWLRAGHLLAAFPAGDAIAVPDARPPRAGGWAYEAPRLVRMSGAPVVPVFIRARCRLEIKIGQSISPEMVSTLPPRDAATYLNWKTHQLGAEDQPALRLVPRLAVSGSGH